MIQENWLDYYQHIPSHISPIFFSIGNFAVHWYGIMYLFSFLGIWLASRIRIKKYNNKYSEDIIFDFLLWAFLSALLGGRIGYVIFYNLNYYLNHQGEIFWPFILLDGRWKLVGFYGMSFYGGLLGFVICLIIFAYRRKIDWRELADFIAPLAPIGYFFVRIGNFINGELFGRVTSRQWGMYFADNVLRHPSQLYEAFFEGFILFFILGNVRCDKLAKGSLAMISIGLYGFFRFWVEFYREVDPQVGFFWGFLTLGQIFSIIIMIASAGYFFIANKNYTKQSDKNTK